MFGRQDTVDFTPVYTLDASARARGVQHRENLRARRRVRIAGVDRHPLPRR